MIRYVGFACMSKKCNTKYQTFRLASFSEYRLKQAITHNLNETERTIQHCISEGIKLFRLSSDLVQFATHEIIKDIDYMSWMQSDLKRIGDIMEIYKETGVRAVFDLHHHYVCNNDGVELNLEAIFATCGVGKVPKIHLSSPKSVKEFRSHSDMIDYEYCREFFEKYKELEFDVMLECKDKDLAVDKFIEDYRREMKL